MAKVNDIHGRMFWQSLLELRNEEQEKKPRHKHAVILRRAHKFGMEVNAHICMGQRRKSVCCGSKNPYRAATHIHIAHISQVSAGIEKSKAADNGLIHFCRHIVHIELLVRSLKSVIR